MQSDPSWFAGRLRELREAKGWTQRQLAEAASIALGTVRALEQGKKGPTWETVLALASALGASCEAFTQEPASAGEPKIGRPRKDQTGPADQAEVEPAEEPTEKKKPARKRKGK